MTCHPYVRVHCAGPRADSHGLCLQPQPEKEADTETNKQTVDAGKDQRKPQLGSTQQAQLMKGKEISNKGLLGREGTGCRGRRTRFLRNCSSRQQAGSLPSRPVAEVLTSAEPDDPSGNDRYASGPASVDVRITSLLCKTLHQFTKIR